LEYPFDCNKFINCWKGRGNLQSCAPGTKFNPKLRICDFPHKFNCSEKQIRSEKLQGNLLIDHCDYLEALYKIIFLLTVATTNFVNPVVAKSGIEETV